MLTPHLQLQVECIFNYYFLYSPLPGRPKQIRSLNTYIYVKEKKKYNVVVETPNLLATSLYSDQAGR